MALTDEQFAEKWATVHKPNCYLNQNWDEAMDALMSTPESYRDENWYQAVSEVTDKRLTCSCGIKGEFKSDLAEHDRDKLTRFFVAYLSKEHGGNINMHYVNLVVDEFLTSQKKEK